MEEKKADTTVTALVQIVDILKKGTPDTTGMIPDIAGYADITKEILKSSHLFEASKKEIKKAQALVNPSSYIAQRANEIKKINSGIAGKVDELVKQAIAKNKTPEELRQIGATALETLIRGTYLELNQEYPLTNLAETIQSAMSGSALTHSDLKTASHKKRRKK